MWKFKAEEYKKVKSTMHVIDETQISDSVVSVSLLLPWNMQTTKHTLY